MLSISQSTLFDRYGWSLYLLCLLITTIQCETTSFLSYEYFSSSSNYSLIERYNQTDGIISRLSRLTPVRRARAFVLVDAKGEYDGCEPSIRPPNFFDGVAVIQRGGDCTFYTKIMRAKQYRASGRETDEWPARLDLIRSLPSIVHSHLLAVLIYDPHGENGVAMWNNQSDILSMYIRSSLGSQLFSLILDSKSYLNISIDPIRGNDDDDEAGSWYGSRSATIFIAVAISVLVSLCLLWFCFYYCQRYRARTAKDRLQSRLTNAAKKALAKMTLITVTDATPFDEPCVICLDNIKTGDVVRQLGKASANLFSV